MIQNSGNSQAKIEHNINIPDYFTCASCTASNYGPRYCDEFQAQGRCSKAMLKQALQSGHVQIVLHLPQGVTQ